MMRSIEPRRKGSAPMSLQTVRTPTCAPSVAFRRVARAALASMSDARTTPLPCTSSAVSMAIVPLPTEHAGRHVEDTRRARGSLPPAQHELRRCTTPDATGQIGDLIQVRPLPPDGTGGGDLEEGIIDRRQPHDAACYGGRLVVRCAHDKLSWPDLLRHSTETEKDLSRHNRLQAGEPSEDEPFHATAIIGCSCELSCIPPRRRCGHTFHELRIRL